MAFPDDIHNISNDIHTIPRLVGDAVEQIGKLVQNEAQLARAELSQKLTQAGLGVAYLAGAGVIAIPVFVVLLIALALWLSTAFGWSPAAGYLAAGAIGAVIAAALALAGLSYLKSDNLKPKATIRQVQRDIAAAKEMAR
jgi:hypothetical protein